MADVWREYKRAQAQRRAQRVKDRVGELMALLPKKAAVEPLHGLTVLRVSLNGVRMTWYPVHGRLQFRGATTDATAQQVARLIKREAARCDTPA